MKNYLRLKNKYSYQRRIDIPWSDLDANGHLNSRAFTRYFEDIRVAYLVEKLDFATNNKELKADSVLTNLYFRYKGQVFFPETILITVGIVDCTKKSVVMVTTFWNQKDMLVATGTGMFLAFDFNKNQTCHWQPHIYKKLQTFRETI